MKVFTATFAALCAIWAVAAFEEERYLNEALLMFDNGSGQPITSAPSTAAPTTVPPTTKAPTTKAPTTKAPTTKAPTTKKPTTKAPTTKKPTTKAPTTKAPTTKKPTTKAPTTKKPTTKKPTTKAPTTKRPTTKKPTPTPSRWQVCKRGYKGCEKRLECKYLCGLCFKKCMRTGKVECHRPTKRACVKEYRQCVHGASIFGRIKCYFRYKGCVRFVKYVDYRCDREKNDD